MHTPRLSPDGVRPSSYHWRVLQEGTLPLSPDGQRHPELEHACTSVLVWPEGEAPRPENTLVTDPGLTPTGLRGAQWILKTLGITLAGVGRFFETHQHPDHLLVLSALDPLPEYERFQPAGVGPLAGIACVPCPGHSPDLTALAFLSGPDRVWVVGDAILNEEWLRAWGYYWPNGYLSEEIVQTWQSVGLILSQADVIVPGHGPAIRVTEGLVRDLLARFPRAECADRCPEVADSLWARVH